MTDSRRPKAPTKMIGNHAIKPATLMMGFGFDPALSEGSLKPPVFLTSTYVFQTASEGKRFFEGITGKSDGSGKAEGLVYGRFNGPNQEILEDRLAVWEGVSVMSSSSNRSFPGRREHRGRGSRGAFRPNLRRTHLRRLAGCGPINSFSRRWEDR